MWTILCGTFWFFAHLDRYKNKAFTGLFGNKKKKMKKKSLSPKTGCAVCYK